MIRPVYMIIFIDRQLNYIYTGKLRDQVDKNLNSIYFIVAQ